MATKIIVQRIDYTDIPKEACEHPNKKDLTQGQGETRNHFCPQCKMHWYKGREWTRDEWREYIEDFSPDQSKYFNRQIV